MLCKICQTEAPKVKTLKVRGKYDADYYLCDNCGFMFVGNPTWLAEAYKAPINVTDTGYVLRNVYLSRKTLILFYFLFGKKPSYLDFAGGYGMLVRLMRDYGFDFYNDDPYTENLFAQGFEYTHQHITALTCFECFEHLPEPLVEINKMFGIGKNIFFSTVLMPPLKTGEKAPPEDWEYYGLNHGQHVAFYSEKTLRYIANKYSVTLHTNGVNLHLFTQKYLAPWYFNFLLSLATFQIDLFIRKSLKSKTVEDHLMLKQKGLV